MKTFQSIIEEKINNIKYQLPASVIAQIDSSSHSKSIFSDKRKEEIMEMLIKSKDNEYITLEVLFQNRFVTKSGCKYQNSPIAPNLQLPIKECIDYDMSYCPNIVDAQTEITTFDIGEKINEEWFGFLEINPMNIVQTKLNKFTKLFTPIALKSESFLQQSWLGSPVFTHQQIKGLSFSSTGMQNPQSSVRRYLDENWTSEYMIKTIPINTRAIKAEQTQLLISELKTKGMELENVLEKDTRNVFDYDLRGIFYKDQKPLMDVPFTMTPMTTFFFNKSIILLLVIRAHASLKQKYEIKPPRLQTDDMKEAKKEINNTTTHKIKDGKTLSAKETEKERDYILYTDKNEFKEAQTQYKKFKSTQKKEEKTMAKHGIPETTKIITQRYGDLSITATMGTGADQIQYTIWDHTTNDKEPKRLMTCKIPIQRLDEYAVNSILAMQYSWYINEACVEFPATLLQWLSPTPEYAQEMSLLWQCQTSSLPATEKFMEFVKEGKIKEPKNRIQRLKRAATFARVRSTSDDVLFIETSLSTPSMASEDFLAVGIEKIGTQPETEFIQNSTLIRVAVDELADLATPVIDSHHILRDDTKVNASSYANAKSSNITEFIKKIDENIFVVNHDPVQSSAAIASLAHPKDDLVQFIEDENVTMAIHAERKRVKEKWEKEFGYEIPVTSIMSLIVNGIGRPVIITLFMKDQTQGAREISVLDPSGKIITQTAESYVRPLCHARKENMIADVDKRAERITEMFSSVNKKKTTDNVRSFSLDFKSFNNKIVLPIMNTVVSRNMYKAGYPLEMIAAYYEIIKRYSNKSLQISLKKMKKHWNSYLLIHHNTGKYKKQIDEFERKKATHTLDKEEDRVFFKKYRSWDNAIKHKIQRAEERDKSIPTILRPEFVKLKKAIDEGKVQQTEVDNIAFVIPFEWGMSQGILGNSATEYTITILKTFLLKSNLIKDRNFDFINMSDDALIVVELVEADLEDLFIKKMDEWVKLFGMKLSSSKCGHSSQLKVFFNSNSWYPEEIDMESVKTVMQLLYPNQTSNLNDIYAEFQSSSEVQVQHVGRYLKLMFKDNLAVDINAEYASTMANWMYLLPEIQAKNWKSIQSVHSLGLFLSRFHFLYYDKMKKFSPEFSGIPVLLHETIDQYLPNLTTCKLLRSSYAGLKPDKTKGFSLSTPVYKKERQKLRFENAVKDVFNHTDFIYSSPDYIKYIMEIMSSGTKEDRSLHLMLSVMHKPFWKVDYKYILPYGEIIIKNLDDVQISAIFQVATILEDTDWKAMTFVDWRQSRNKPAKEVDSVLYMLEGKEVKINPVELYSRISGPVYERDQMVHLPCSVKNISYMPGCNKEDDSPLSYFKRQVLPSSWLLPQLSAGGTWIHEGIYIREYFYDIHKKYRCIVALLDKNVVHKICYDIDLKENKIKEIPFPPELFKIVMKNDGLVGYDEIETPFSWNVYDSFKWKDGYFFSALRPNETRNISSKDQMRRRFHEFIEINVHGRSDIKISMEDRDNAE